MEYIGIDLTVEAISVEVIGTIIDRILEVEGHSFKGIAIYKVIHARDNPSFQKFLEKYNKLLVFFDECPHCKEKIERMNLKDRKPSNVDMICFECFKFTCDLCNDYVDDDRCAIRKCTHCELTFCGDHATTWEDEPDPNICSGCKDFHCHLCTELDHVGSAQSCEQCMYDVFCTDCVIKNRSNRNPYGSRGCDNCLVNHFDTIAARNKKQKDEFAEKNAALVGENKQLREEIEELQKKMSSGLGILG